MFGNRANLLLSAALALGPLTACCSSSVHASPPADGPADVAANTEVEARVRALLSGYEHVPTAEDWARAGTPAEVAATLIRLASTPSGQTVTALRATSSLAHFPRPEVARFLGDLLADATRLSAHRGKAAIALAAGFGDAKAGLIAPLFASPDEALREDAIRAFRRLLSPSAERFLGERMKAEPSERLRGEIASARAAIGEARSALERQGGLPAGVRDLPPIPDPGQVR
jgi:hypothetical protein